MRRFSRSRILGIGCLGDLGRYRMAIEDGDIRDREVWTIVTRNWYFKASDRKLTVSRLYHHISILARPNVLQVIYHCKSLTVSTPFGPALEPTHSLFKKAPTSRSPPANVGLVKLHEMWSATPILTSLKGFSIITFAFSIITLVMASLHLHGQCPDV